MGQGGSVRTPVPAIYALSGIVPARFEFEKVRQLALQIAEENQSVCASCLLPTVVRFSLSYPCRTSFFGLIIIASEFGNNGRHVAVPNPVSVMGRNALDPFQHEITRRRTA